MAYLVDITRRAARDLGHIYEDIHAEESEAAFAWYRGLKESVLSLELHAAGCPVTPENGKLRHLLYGKKPHIYRVIFRILEKQEVEVLHIRHGARQQFNPRTPR
jgi:toxin ParE1/3/4